MVLFCMAGTSACGSGRVVRYFEANPRARAGCRPLHLVWDGIARANVDRNFASAGTDVRRSGTAEITLCASPSTSPTGLRVDIGGPVAPTSPIRIDVDGIVDPASLAVSVRAFDVVL